MRKAVTDVVLNTILTLIIVVVTFSVGFYIYANFASNSNALAVMEGFDNFIKPIREVCTLGGTASAFDVKLPFDPSWVYGIMQTKISSFGAGIPIQMHKCENGYCLCLFRLAKSSWDTWGDATTAAPLWHWNPPGLELFIQYLGKVIVQWILSLVTQLLAKAIAQLILGDVSCKTVCEASKSNPFGALAYVGCILACNTAVTAASYAISGFVQEFLDQLIRELWESIVFFNNPNHLMTAEDEDNLIFKGDSFDCDLNGELNKDLDLAEDFISALTAGGIGALKGAIDGAIAGFFKGLGEAAEGLNTGDFIQGATSTVKATSLIKFLNNKFVKETIKGVLKGAAWGVKFKLDQLSGMSSYYFEIDFSSKPECNVLELLSGRLYVDSADFVWQGKWSSPKTVNDLNAYNMDSNTLQIIECVRVDELGGECTNDTAVLLDSDHDIYLSYRLVDPFNDPYGALFCVYSQQQQGQEQDFLDELLAFCSVPFICDYLVIPVVRFLVGDVVLAGQTAIEGLFTECLVPKIGSVQESEYFQYWVPYPDYYGITGSDGQIPLMNVELVKYPDEYSSKTQCEGAALGAWVDCLINYNNWLVNKCVTEFSTIASSICSVIVLATLTPEVIIWGDVCNAIDSGSDPSSFTTLLCGIAATTSTFTGMTREALMDYKESNPLSNIFPFITGAWGGEIIMRTFLKESEEFQPVVDPENPNSLTCREEMNLRFARCKPGVHINPLGVLR